MWLFWKLVSISFCIYNLNIICVSTNTTTSILNTHRLHWVQELVHHIVKSELMQTRTSYVRKAPWFGSSHQIESLFTQVLQKLVCIAFFGGKFSGTSRVNHWICSCWTQQLLRKHWCQGSITGWNGSDFWQTNWWFYLAVNPRLCVFSDRLFALLVVSQSSKSQFQK